MNREPWVILNPPVWVPAKAVTNSPSLVVMDAQKLERTCLNCGHEMSERKCDLVCSCGFFVSSEDWL